MRGAPSSKRRVLDDFPAARLVEPDVARIRPNLNVAVSDRHRFDSGSGLADSLGDARSDRAEEVFVDSPEIEPRPSDRNLRRAVEQPFGVEQKRDALAERNGRRVALHRRDERVDVRAAGSGPDAASADGGARTSDRDRTRGGRIDAGVAGIGAGGKSPRAVDEGANAEAGAARIGERGYDAVTHFDPLGTHRPRNVRPRNSRRATVTYRGRAPQEFQIPRSVSSLLGQFPATTARTFLRTICPLDNCIPFGGST